MYKNTRAALALIFSSSLIMSGCSSDNNDEAAKVVTYTGNTSAAVIDAGNAEEISVAATEGTTQAISEFEASDKNPYSPRPVSSGLSRDDLNTTISQIISSVRTRSNNLVVAVTLGPNELAGDPNYCGGSLTAPDDVNATSGVIVFSDFCYDIFGPTIMNGAITFSSTATTLSISYTNFSVSFDSESFTINSSVLCNLDINGDPVLPCSISSNYVGSTGLTYRIDDFTVSGDLTFGFDVDVTFYHPTHGSVDITTTSSILFECTGPQPSSGAIDHTGAGGTSGSITFDSCTDYTYCYDLGGGPTCNTGTW